MVVQKSKLNSIECKYLLKIIRMWKDKFPDKPVPEWIRRRYGKVCLKINY